MTWLAALALTLLLLAGVEGFWRARGHAPSVTDTPALWALRRSEVSAAQRQVVLLGASRIQLDFDSATFHQRYPDYRLINLSLNGISPIVALRDLADRSSFRGIVLVDAHPDSMERATWEDQRPSLAYYYHEWRPSERMECRIRTALQARLCLLRPDLGLKPILVALRSSHAPQPLYLMTAPDRSRKADYTKLDIARHRAWRVQHVREKYARPPSTAARAAWQRDLQEINRWIDAIQRRGGRVVFAPFIVTGESREAYHRCYPRRDYWDYFVRRTRALCLFYEDIPALDAFTCPDTSHLDARDAPAYTRALLAEMAARGALPVRRGEGDREKG